MILQTYNHLTIREIMDKLTSTEKSKLTIKTTEGDILLTSDTVTKYLLHEFGSFECYNVTKPYDFIDYYETWVQIHYHNIKCIYDTLNAEYNPLANYDKTSTISTVGTASTNGNNTVTTQATTEDSANFNDTAKSTSDSNTSADSNTTVTEKTTGNIGTMTTGYMLSEEIQNRIKYQFAEIVLKLFANDCLV